MNDPEQAGKGDDEIILFEVGDQNLGEFSADRRYLDRVAVSVPKKAIVEVETPPPVDMPDEQAARLGDEAVGLRFSSHAAEQSGFGEEDSPTHPKLRFNDRPLSGLPFLGLTTLAVLTAMGVHEHRDFEARVAARGATAPAVSVPDSQAHVPVTSPAAPEVQTFVPVYDKVVAAFADDRSVQHDQHVAQGTAWLLNNLYNVDGFDHTWRGVESAHPWHDTPEALAHIKGHMRHWSGWKNDLSVKAHDVDGWLAGVEKKEGAQQALLVAEEISAIHDPAVNDLAVVEQIHEGMARSVGDAKQAVLGGENPGSLGQVEVSKSPERFADARLDSPYEVPAAAAVLMDRAESHEVPDVSAYLEPEEETVPDVSEFLVEEVDATDAPDPLHVKPIVQASFSPVEEAFFASAPVVEHPMAPVAKSTWKDKLASAASSVKSSFGKWFGRA